MVVRAVVEEIKRLLEQKIRQAVMGALNRNDHSPIPHVNSIDWKWTIGRNLKNYNKELKRIIPERVYFYSRAQRTNNWTVIVDMDQSGSMADSVVYGAVVGSIFASLPALDTRVVAFDTEFAGQSFVVHGNAAIGEGKQTHDPNATTDHLAKTSHELRFVAPLVQIGEQNEQGLRRIADELLAVSD